MCSIVHMELALEMPNWHVKYWSDVAFILTCSNVDLRIAAMCRMIGFCVYRTSARYHFKID